MGSTGRACTRWIGSKFLKKKGRMMKRTVCLGRKLCRICIAYIYGCITHYRAAHINRKSFDLPMKKILSTVYILCYIYLDGVSFRRRYRSRPRLIPTHHPHLTLEIKRLFHWFPWRCVIGGKEKEKAELKNRWGRKHLPFIFRMKRGCPLKRMLGAARWIKFTKRGKE